MRIVIASQYYAPAYAMGGTVANAVALAESLAKAGHAVSVVSTNMTGASSPRSRKSRIKTLRGVTVYYLGTWMSFNKSHFNPGVYWFALPRLRDTEVIHLIGLYDSIGIALSRFAKRRNIPYTVEPAGMLLSGLRSIRAKRIYNCLIGKRILGDAQAIVVTSQKERSDAIQFGIDPAKLLLRRNGVDLSEYRALPPRGNFRKAVGISTDSFLIVWLGRIDPMKNLEQLLLALADLVELNWQLAIIGPSENSEYDRRLRNLTQAVGLDRKVHFCSALYGSEKLSALTDADLLVLVSISENWGNSVQEAIAAGVPVVVTETCGVSQIVEGRGGLVVRQDVAGIRDGILRLLKDRNLYLSYKHALPELAKQLSWNEPAKEMADLFDRLRMGCWAGEAGGTRNGKESSVSKN